MAFLPTSPVERETVHGDNGAIRSLGEQWVRKNYTFISSAKPEGERERDREREPPLSRWTKDSISYSQYAPRPRETHGWANLPASMGNPWRRSPRAKSWRAPYLPLPASRCPFPTNVSTESKFDRFHGEIPGNIPPEENPRQLSPTLPYTLFRIAWFRDSWEIVWSVYCSKFYYFIVITFLSFFKGKRRSYLVRYDTIRYDAMRYDTIRYVSFHSTLLYPVLKGSWRRPDWVFPIKSRIW